MHLFDLTLATPAENLALDEALLDEAEAASTPRESLRLWESPEPFVVLGRGSQAALEAKLDFCRQHDIPILRRTSGGAAVVAAPGSLMYAVVLNYELRPALRSLDAAHRFVLDTTLAALAPLVPHVARQGTSDLAFGEHKFSGNSLRCKRRSFLYHGTLLYAVDLQLVDRCLAMPPRQPEYRQNRGHSSFIANLPLDADTMRLALVAAWQGRTSEVNWPRQRVGELVATRYSQPDWNLQR